MSDSVYTTPQSVTSKAQRRRALTPPRRASFYCSPMQVVDLCNKSKEDLKESLLEAEQIIQDLRTERDALQDTLVDKAGLSESVIIERSNRVSTQETRIFRRDMSLLEEDLKQKQSQIRILQDKCRSLEMEQDRMKDTVKNGDEDKKESEKEMSNLRSRCHDLESQLLAKNEEIFAMNGELHEKSMKLNEFEAKMARLTGENARLEEQIRKLRDSEKKRLELMEKERKSMDFEQENTRKVLSEVRQLSDRLECLTPVRKETDVEKRKREDILQLSAKVIEETMSDLKSKNARLERDLIEKQEIIKVTREELEQLRKTMEEVKGDSDQAAKYLHDENMKNFQLTRQKADIRCDLLEARRQLEGFDKKRQDLEKQRDEAQEEVRRIREEKRAVQSELDSLSKLAKERDEQIEELQLKIVEFELTKRDNDALKNQLSQMHERLSQMGKHLVMADQQSSHFKSLKETAEGSRKRAIDQCNEMVVRIRNLEKSLENQRKVEQEVEVLRAENDRKQKKIEFMKEEIDEVHLDYRQELSRMAETENSRKSESLGVLEAENLKLKVSQKESELRSSKKTIEELKADNQKLQEILDEIRQNHSKIVDENMKLRKGMTDALEKIAEYKRNFENSQEKCESLEKSCLELSEKLSQMEDQLQEKCQQVHESELVVSQLHSQINAKQVKQPKLGRRSTLLSTLSEMDHSEVDTSVYRLEAEEMRALEEQKLGIISDLEAKKRQLADFKKSNSLANTTTIIETSTTTTSHSATEIRAPSTGIMRHDIPHKWKSFLHWGLSMKCALCYSEIYFLSQAKKCSHCDVKVHEACAPRVHNTCGMPAQCATYYRENEAPQACRMNGWLRVYKDDVPGSTWTSCWASMDLAKISFYTNDGADMDKPFFKIDLNQEQWVLRTGQEPPVECEKGASSTTVLTIKMPRRSVYIMAMSLPASRRWFECLQIAQRKRMISNSKMSSEIAESQCLLVLNSPNNLRISKAHTIEDWILFATQTGLFFTSISQPRNPIRIAGPNSVTSLEIMSEIKCIAMVVNTTGQLALCPMDSLILAMQSTHPSVRSEVLPEFKHVSTIKYHQINGHRFLMISDETHLHIRKYNATRDVFSHFAKIHVPEPVTSIECAPKGIIFASDTFYYVSLDCSNCSDVTARALLPPRPSDYPISAQVLSPSEILLAYQNYGIFVNLYGEETRRTTIEWEKMPLEFAYSSPFLYVIHDDLIEVLEISEGPEKTILPERAIFECVNAHIIGRQYEGVLVSVSSQDSTEVHRFTASSLHKQRMTVSKRRGISPVNTLKRVKN